VKIRTAVIEQHTICDCWSHVTVQGFDPEHIYGGRKRSRPTGKISNESPIGAALMNHKVGEEVLVETPGGKLKFKILKVE
jgi:transcription elongation factor GreA